MECRVVHFCSAHRTAGIPNHSVLQDVQIPYGYGFRLQKVTLWSMLLFVASIVQVKRKLFQGEDESERYGQIPTLSLSMIFSAISVNTQFSLVPIIWCGKGVEANISKQRVEVISVDVEGTTAT